MLEAGLFLFFNLKPSLTDESVLST
uniref:Uncharacterized protein n=1 Tax=Anguilla anguilla TaxID=7936 RepID=A0A0E9WFC0_ANGAN